ncbi:zinc finger domain-containing protein [Clostridium sp. MCC353]|uniref:zinc finger domain-containing protein n=1 Tax=Clostridium sp. MCC353 TaxID=2592646 RepID=UPI001C00C50E|nr:zinc finger domain-containing protein [Clostridium sp. MCC353]
MKDAEWERLAAVIPERLSYFIETDRTTPEEYLEAKGQDYRNTPFLQVYGREGKVCPRCGAALCRIVVGGRSSVYCPACQI